MSGSISRKQVVAAQLKRLEREMANLERFPESDDAFADGTVIKFEKTGSGVIYTYAAVKAKSDIWYITGRRVSLNEDTAVSLDGGPRTYGFLIELIEDSPVYVATRWQSLAQVMEYLEADREKVVEYAAEVEITADTGGFNAPSDDADRRS